jgi:poly(rC)-binding protein 3/4
MLYAILWILLVSYSLTESLLWIFQVLVSAKEDPSLELPPAIDALMRVFKRINGITDGSAEGTQGAAVPGICVARLLVPGAQAINLIGKQGATIKAIQESTSATIRVISIGKVFLTD